MSGEASSSQLGAGSSDSGALSHVYVSSPPLRCNVPESRGLCYDDGNKLLLSLTSDKAVSWKTAPFSPHVAPTSDSIGEGPVLSIRYSLDAKFIAIQRSGQEIQLWHRETGEIFSHRTEAGSILGFFWTDCPLCDLVVIKTSGLDLFACDSQTKSLNLVDTRKVNVSWYAYTHESCLVLLASGMQSKSFTGFQISSAGILRLPRFEMAMAKSEVNSKPVLAAEDVYIVTIYGRIYCLQVDRVAMLLHSYRFYRDAVIQQGSLPIYSSKIAVSVVDNVLLVHQVDAKVVLLYDMFADSRAPISAPLPLLFRGFPRSSSFTSRSSGVDGESSEVHVSDHKAFIYGDDWTFLVPDLICDVGNKLLWKICLDLEAISSSSSEVPSVLEFLQRRKLEASKVKQLCLTITRTIILERRPVPLVARAVDVLVSSYSHSIKTGSYQKGLKHETSTHVASTVGHGSNDDVGNNTVNQSTILSSDSEDDSHFGSLKSNAAGLSTIDRENLPSANGSNNEVQSLSSWSPNLGSTESQEMQISSPAVSPDEMYSAVFAPVEEEMVGDPTYLVGIIVEFLRSANLEKIKVNPNLYVLTTQLLARNERYAELRLFIINKVIEPSKEVAMQLFESGRQDSQIRKLGLDMLRQLFLHHDYVVLLVQDGYYLEALRYARKHKVITVRPSLFLEAALASNDSQLLAAVLRFFSDFTPGFRKTMDHHTYYRILNEMNSAVAT